MQGSKDKILPHFKVGRFWGSEEFECFCLLLFYTAQIPTIILGKTLHKYLLSLHELITYLLHFGDRAERGGW